MNAASSASLARALAGIKAMSASFAKATEEKAPTKSRDPCVLGIAYGDAKSAWSRFPAAMPLPS